MAMAINTNVRNGATRFAVPNPSDNVFGETPRPRNALYVPRGYYLAGTAPYQRVRRIPRLRIRSGNDDPIRISLKTLDDYANYDLHTQSRRLQGRSS